MGHSLHRGRIGWRGLGVLEALRPMGVVLIAIDRDRWLDPGRSAGNDVGVAELAGVSRQLLGLRKVLGQCAKALQHRGELLVVGRLGDLGHQHQHGLGIHHRLGAGALLEGTPGDGHDAGLFVSEVDLIVGTRSWGGRLGWLAAGLSTVGFLRRAGVELGLMVGLLSGGALGRPLFDLNLGRGDRCQAILAALDLHGHAHAVGDVGPIGLLGHCQQLLNLALELGLNDLGMPIGQRAMAAGVRVDLDGAEAIELLLAGDLQHLDKGVLKLLGETPPEG